MHRPRLALIRMPIRKTTKSPSSAAPCFFTPPPPPRASGAAACRSASAAARRSPRSRAIRLYGATCSATNARSSSRSSSPRATTNAIGRSPASASGTRDHRRVGHRRVRAQHRLELGGRDLEALDLDQLLDAGRRGTGSRRRRSGRCRRCAASRRRRSSRPSPPGCRGSRSSAAARAPTPRRRRSRPRCPASSRPTEPCRTRSGCDRRDRDHRAELGDPVALGDDAAEPLRRRALELGAGRRAAAADDPQRRQVEPSRRAGGARGAAAPAAGSGPGRRRCCSIARSIASGSNRGIATTVAPLASACSSTTIRPMLWKNGARPSTRSPSRVRVHRRGLAEVGDDRAVRELHDLGQPGRAARGQQQRDVAGIGRASARSAGGWPPRARCTAGSRWSRPRRRAAPARSCTTKSAPLGSCTGTTARPRSAGAARSTRSASSP